MGFTWAPAFAGETVNLDTFDLKRIRAVTLSVSNVRGVASIGMTPD
ncbi:hypothetical protein BH10PSE3_BH10PSE3_41880 [soil metagenome]